MAGVDQEEFSIASAPVAQVKKPRPMSNSPEITSRKLQKSRKKINFIRSVAGLLKSKIFQP
jgi:hypothetical protein